MRVINNELTPIYNGQVLVNETALQDQAVKNVLESLAADSFKFKSNYHGDRITFSDLISGTK